MHKHLQHDGKKTGKYHLAKNWECTQMKQIKQAEEVIAQNWITNEKQDKQDKETKEIFEKYISRNQKES
jgi:hypothetical protein